MLALGFKIWVRVCLYWIGGESLVYSKLVLPKKGGASISENGSFKMRLRLLRTDKRWERYLWVYNEGASLQLSGLICAQSVIEFCPLRRTVRAMCRKLNNAINYTGIHISYILSYFDKSMGVIYKTEPIFMYIISPRSFLNQNCDSI